MTEKKETSTPPRKPNGIITTQRNGQTIVAELFFNHSGTYIGAKPPNELAVRMVFNVGCGIAVACLKWGAPHLRHSKAMHLTEADVNPFFIRDFLGHSDIKTTGVCAKASLKMKKAALNKLNDSKQDPMPMPNCDKSWTEDQDLMQWLSSLGK